MDIEVSGNRKKLAPLIFTDLILPMEVLEDSNIAPVPTPDVETPSVEIPATFKICGSE